MEVSDCINTKNQIERIQKHDMLPHTINANDLMKNVYPEPVWIIPGIIPEGLTLLAGAPKTGKSYLALNIAIAVALGTYALGEIKVDQKAVLYLALEDTERRLQRRLKQFNINESDLMNLTFANHWPKGEKGFNTFLLWNKKHPETKLIIVDTLQMIRENITYNTYESDYEEISKLKRISEMINTPMIFLHHTRKQSSDDPLFEVSGTLGITGVADTIIRLKRNRRKPTAEFFISSRDIEEKELAIKFDENAGWVLLGNADDYKQTVERQEILDIVKKAENPISPKEIAGILNKNENTTRVLVKRLKDEGYLKCVTYGKYMYNSVNDVNGINDLY